MVAVGVQYDTHVPLSCHHCTDLILRPGRDAVLFGDQLHDLGLVEEHGLVQRRRAELWSIHSQFYK